MTQTFWRLNFLNTAGFLVTIILANRQPFCVAYQREFGDNVSPTGPGRVLASQPASLSPGRLRELDIPSDVDFLFQLESDCPEVIPPQVKARMTTLCSVVHNTRRCLGKTMEDPQFPFKNCSRANNGCPPLLYSNEETICIYSGLGIDVSGTNKSLDTRCDVPLSDLDLFQERQLAFGQAIANDPVSICYIGQPASAIVTTKVVCMDEKPRFYFNWAFEFPPDADDGPYNCLLNRQCLQGEIYENSLCYRGHQATEQGKPQARSTANNTGSGSATAVVSSLSGSLMKELGIPSNSQVVHQSSSSCNKPADRDPDTTESLCEISDDARQCLNKSDTGALLIFEGCTQSQGCQMMLSREATDCHFIALGVNLSNGPLCDFPKTESHVFLPLASVRNSTELDCLSEQGQDILLHSSVDCEQGRRQLFLNWTLPFSSNVTNESFTCILNSWCNDDGFQQESICYKLPSSLGLVSGEEGVGVLMRPAVMCLLLVIGTLEVFISSLL